MKRQDKFWCLLNVGLLMKHNNLFLDFNCPEWDYRAIKKLCPMMDEPLMEIVICSSACMRFSDVSEMCNELTNCLAMTNTRRGQSVHLGLKFTLSNRVRVELMLTLDWGLFWPLKLQCFLTVVPLHIWSLSFVWLFSLVSFSMDMFWNETSKCWSCRSTACIFVLPSFSSSRFSSLHADNRALCLKA